MSRPTIRPNGKTTRRQWLEKAKLASYSEIVDFVGCRNVYELHGNNSFEQIRVLVDREPGRIVFETSTRDRMALAKYLTQWPYSRLVIHEPSDLEWALPLGYASMFACGQIDFGDTIELGDYLLCINGPARVENISVRERSSFYRVEASFESSEFPKFLDA